MPNRTTDSPSPAPSDRLQPASNVSSRRRFLATASALSLAAICRISAAQPDPSASDSGRSTPAQDRLGLADLPNFCSHEHWGSIDSIGRVPEGFRADVVQGATPTRRTGICDILLDPYLGGWLRAAGTNPDTLARTKDAENSLALAQQSPVPAMAALRPALAGQQMTGAYQCIRRGLLKLHGFDLDGDDEAIASLDASVARRYQQLFPWYVDAMRQAHFTELIRPVHPEFFFRRQTLETAAAEARFTHTILRIDPFLALWRKDSPRRDNLAKLVGIEPADAASWRTFLGRLFDLAAKQGVTGIKQAQAYSRSLDFGEPSESGVVWRGDLNAQQVRAFQNWVVHQCCQQAHDRGWPHQVHVGTNNLAESSPMPLARLATRYVRMKIVQIHCWPFLKEAGWLAKFHANMYLDTCWLPVLSHAFFREAMATWLNYVPLQKIMCAHDSTSVEMAVGSSLFTREILAEALLDHSRNLGLSDRRLRAIASDLLHNNAVAVYGIGNVQAAP